MAEYNIDISKLPEDVREKLAELDLELSEGKGLMFNTILVELITHSHSNLFTYLGSTPKFKHSSLDLLIASVNSCSE